MYVTELYETLQKLINEGKGNYYVTTVHDTGESAHDIREINIKDNETEIELY